MKRPALKVVSVGECTIDNYLDLQQQFVGGISLNFAVQCKRSGAENVSLISRVGDDYGTRILQELSQEGIDSTYVKMIEGKTARQDISLTAHGERIFPPGGYQPGVMEGYLLKETELRFVQGHNLIASAFFKQVEPLFHQVMDSPQFEGWRVADLLDLSDYNKEVSVVEQIAGKVTVLFISGDHELVERLRSLSRESRCLIVVTLGNQGSVALLNGERHFQPPLNVTKIVDSTGCGDAFQAAFTISLWRTDDIRYALQCGAQQAALVLQHYGAI